MQENLRWSDQSLKQGDRQHKFLSAPSSTKPSTLCSTRLAAGIPSGPPAALAPDATELPSRRCTQKMSLSLSIVPLSAFQKSSSGAAANNNLADLHSVSGTSRKSPRRSACSSSLQAPRMLYLCWGKQATRDFLVPEGPSSASCLWALGSTSPIPNGRGIEEAKHQHKISFGMRHYRLSWQLKSSL